MGLPPISESDVSVSDPKQEVDPEFRGWMQIVRRVLNVELVTVLDTCLLLSQYHSTGLLLPHKINTATSFTHSIRKAPSIVDLPKTINMK